jgi:hypothetical protein
MTWLVVILGLALLIQLYELGIFTVARLVGMKPRATTRPRRRGLRARRVLAAADVEALALRRGRVIPVDELIDALWGEELPPAPRNARLQHHVTRLRAALGQGAIIDTRARPSRRRARGGGGSRRRGGSLRPRTRR